MGMIFYKHQQAFNAIYFLYTRLNKPKACSVVYLLSHNRHSKIGRRYLLGKDSFKTFMEV